MKSKLVILITALVLLPIAGISLAHAQTDETLRVSIPFTFYAGDQVMPAGSYEVRIDLQNRLITIADDTGSNETFVVATTSEDGSETDELIFDHVGGQYYLNGLKSDLIDM